MCWLVNYPAAKKLLIRISLAAIGLMIFMNRNTHVYCVFWSALLVPYAGEGWENDDAVLVSGNVGYSCCRVAGFRFLSLVGQSNVFMFGH